VKRALLLAAAGICLALAGCNNSCQTLANNICECSPTQAAQENCQAEASIANGTATLSTDDLNRCSALQNSCDCRMLATGSYAAKVACGLARPDPNDSSLSPQ
jgi:hypothetical protein